MGGLYRHRVHHRVDRHARKHLLLLQRDAKTVECLQHLGVNLVEVLGPIFLDRRGVIADGLEVDVGHVEVAPFRRGHRQPVAVGFEAELQEPFRLVLLFGNQPDYILAQPHGNHLRVDIGHEAILVVARGDIVYDTGIILALRGVLPRSVIILAAGEILLHSVILVFLVVLIFVHSPQSQSNG